MRDVMILNFFNKNRTKDTLIFAWAHSCISSLTK